jgi:elongation factor Ts
MAAITASMVAALRAKTDAPMMECKKALTEAQGDLERAEELLRVKLNTKASKVAVRVTAEGMVAAYVSDAVGVLIELNCETDFVSQNTMFLDFANQLAKLVATNHPTDVAALSEMPFESSDFATVEAARAALVGRLGENITIRRFMRYAVCAPQKLAYYLHGARMGALVVYEGENAQIGKDVAMHVAAMKPIALCAAEVPSASIEAERHIAEKKAKESGKPAEIVAKMVQGSVDKYLKEVSLLDQPFVKNDKQTVAQMLATNETKVHAFTLYVVGEGIEKRQNDFAAEVAAQVASAQQNV